MKKGPVALGVNLDHSATLRQARYRGFPRAAAVVEPNVLALAFYAEKAGADAITLHLREDRRHIQDEDVRKVKEALQVPLNFEMAATPEMRDFALEISPRTVLLVPEKREELSTEGGLHLPAYPHLESFITSLKQAGIAVSLFIDSGEESMTLAKELGADSVELHTGTFANLWDKPQKQSAALEALRRAAEKAHSLGLNVHAGHGINYTNIKCLASLPHLEELNIGHSILSRALFTGIEEAVSSMKALIARYA